MIIFFPRQLLPREEHVVVLHDLHGAENGHIHLYPVVANTQHPL